METFVAIVRKATVTILIASTAILTFLAILSIWDVLPRDVSGKSIGSMALIGGVSLMFFAATAIIQRDSSRRYRFGIGWIMVIVVAALYFLIGALRNF